MTGITGPLWLWFKTTWMWEVTTLRLIESSLRVTSNVPWGTPGKHCWSPSFPYLCQWHTFPCSVSSVFMFADDTKFICSINSEDQKYCLHQDLDIIHTWYQRWKLFINPSKSSTMNVSLTTSTQCAYTIRSECISSVHHQRDPGVHVVDLDFSDWSRMC